MSTVPSPPPDIYTHLRDALINRRPLEPGEANALLMILAALDNSARLLDETAPADGEAAYAYRAGVAEFVIETYRREMGQLS